jgi:dyslexia susceptibility 1 candidate gene 1 protein
MPLEPKYRWEESAAGLRVHVQLRGASPKSCDVSVSDCFVKVNAPPNLLALDLHGLIDDTASTVSFKADGLVLNLPKASPQLWSTLKAEPAEHGGRAGLKARREASIDRQRAAAEAARQQRITQRSVHKRLATHSQIDLDNAQRNLIDARKAEEKRAAEEDVYATLETVESQAAAAAATETGAPRAPEPELLVEDVTATPSAAMEPQRQPQPPPPKQQQMPLRSLKPTPITFTKDRKRPDHMQNLPARTKPEDLPRNESAPKPRNDDTVDLGEQNALFLKDRGDSFFGKKDYEAAVNAYSAALTLDRNLPAVFSNRAACFFCLSDYQRCVEDSSAANRLLRAKLELLLADKGAPGEEMQDSLKTELATTNRSLLRVLARRASARTFLGQHARAVTDYKEAVTLDPENSALRADLVEAEAAAAAAAQAEAEASEGRWAHVFTLCMCVCVCVCVCVCRSSGGVGCSVLGHRSWLTHRGGYDCVQRAGAQGQRGCTLLPGRLRGGEGHVQRGAGAGWRARGLPVEPRGVQPLPGRGRAGGGGLHGGAHRTGRAGGGGVPPPRELRGGGAEAAAHSVAVARAQRHCAGAVRQPFGGAAGAQGVPRAQPERGRARAVGG